MESFDANSTSLKDYAKSLQSNSRIEGIREGIPVTAITSMAIVLDGTMSSAEQGSTNVNATRVNPNAEDVRHTEAHEVGHFMLQGSNRNPNTPSKHDSMGGILKYKIKDQNGTTIQSTENVNKSNVKRIIENIPVKKD